MHLHIPPTTLNISRSLMPQIKSDDVQEWLSELVKKGISVTKQSVHVRDLKAAQGEVNREKIIALMQKDLHGKPVIATKDGYVLDGNHRWIAKLNKDPHSHIPAIVIGLNVMDAIQEARSFDKVFYKTVNESRVVNIKNVLRNKYH